MATRRDDEYLKLQESVDSWVAEVTQARSVLAQSLKVHVSPRPAFRLVKRKDASASRSAASIGSADPAPAAADGISKRLREVEVRARDARLELNRATAELDFAREQLNTQIRLRTEAEKKQDEAELRYEETVHALGHAQISVDELRRQLRGKEWALEKAMTALESQSVERNAGSIAEVETLRSEAAALHSRLETLTVELRDARDRAAREHDAALEAQARLAAVERDSSRSADLVDSLSRQVQEYAERLRHTGQQLDDARAALSRQTRERAEGSPEAEKRIADLDVALQLAERRAADLAAALQAKERESLDGMSDAIAEAALLSENYDALADSHMTLRAEITSLQEQVIARDHDLAQLREKMNRATREAGQSKVVERDESESDLGREWLIKALRRELDATRDALERTEMDHSLLRNALVAEIASLRELAAERDFVIHHQAAQLDDAKVEDGAGGNGETLLREIRILRQRIDEREAIVKRLRSEMAEAEERASATAGEETAELQAALRIREADLDRARERVNFLRRLLGQNGPQTQAAKHRETTAPQSSPNVARTELAKRPERAVPKPVSSDGDLDVSRYQTNAEIQREVEMTLVPHAFWPVLAVVGTLAGLGLLGLVALAFLLG